MSFSPVVPFSGFAGWRFLERTRAAQKTAFEASPEAVRDAAYFREKIRSVKTAEALVNDRRLLSVALGAFGLEADLGNKFFIRKVLEDGTLKADSLANKLADKQYAALATAFGFDLKPPRTQVSSFPDKILTAWKTRRFEAAVGAQSNDMRLAMNAGRELAALAAKPGGSDTKWLTVIGNTPLRQVFERAFGLPSSFVSLDLDKQVATLRDRAERLLGKGEVSQFTEGKQVEKLIRAFFTRSEAGIAAANPGTAALSLLQGGGVLVRY